MAGWSDQIQVDPVCGKTVNQSTSELSEFVSRYHDHDYYFCSQECKTDFDRAPQYFISHDPGPPEYESSAEWQP